MQKFLDKIKSLVIYDADREFYAKVFPNSVAKKDLMRLRRMNVEDLPAVIAIENQNYSFPWREFIFKDCLKSVNYSNWVCEDLDAVVGYIIVSTTLRKTHIMNICVNPTMQRQGIGNKLLANVIERAKKKSDIILLEVRPSNKSAISFYKKRGFNKTVIRKDYYQAGDGSREDAIVLALYLV